MIDIEESKNTIRAHARACYGDPDNPAWYECCGVIVRVGKKQEVICCRNVAEDPRHAYFIHPDDAAAAYDRGEVVALYHSHCNEPPTPSDGDKALAEKQGVPVIIVSWPADSWEVYEPKGWKAELVGRPFVFGVLDCLTLVRDYFTERHGIEIPDFRYEPRFWDKGVNLYGENLPKHFVRVDPKDIRASDLILMKLESELPNHVAIYLGDGMILHHPAEHLSGTHPYVYNRGYYALATQSVWRHKELV
jgi:proteasome lid subunit RPN8/RPN11